MNLELSPRIHGLASLGLLLTAVFGVWGTVGKPWIESCRHAVDAVRDARFERDRARRLAAEAEQLPAERGAAETQALKSLLVWTDGTSNPETGMQETVDSIVRTTGFKLESMRVAATTPQGNLTRLTLDVKGEGPEPAVMALLATIEGHSPALVIDHLVLRALDDPAGTRLVAELRLSGFGAPLDAFGAGGR